MKRNLALGLMCALIIMCVSCAAQTPTVLTPGDVKITSPYVAQAMKVIGGVAETYNAAWKTFRDMRAAGLITNQQWLDGKAAAKKFYSTYQDTLAILEKIEYGELSENSGQNAILMLNQALDGVKSNLAAKIAEAQANQQGGVK